MTLSPATLTADLTANGGETVDLERDFVELADGRDRPPRADLPSE